MKFNVENIQCQLFVDDYSLDFCFGEIDKFILRLFPISTLSSQEIQTKRLYQLSTGLGIPDGLTPIIMLELSVRDILERLEILGYTLEKSKLEFEIAKNLTIDTQVSDINGNPDFQYPSFPDQEAFATPKEARKYLSNLGYNSFLRACRNIIQQKRRRIIKPFGLGSKFVIPDDISVPIERYLVCHGLGSFQFHDKISYIRLLLDEIDKQAKVCYLFKIYPKNDINEIINLYSYYFSPQDPGLRYGLNSIIITEGKTDSRYLGYTLKKCYPYLTDLFSFIDFSIKDGNADAVAKSTLALASSGVPNNIIALFDNDVEGNRARRLLESTLIPRPTNIHILSYPDLNSATSYPILKSNGILQYRNVNGLGCAIEMYLGENVLKEGEELIPLTESPNGQLSFRKKHKAAIQSRFEKMIMGEVDKSSLIGLTTIIDAVIEQLKK